MQRFLFFALLTLTAEACNFDQVKQQQFAGDYDVTIHSSEARKDLEKAGKDLEEDVAKAKEDVQKSIEQAKKDVVEDLGEESHAGKAVQKIVEGAGKFAEGMADLGEGLGNLGLGIGKGVLNGLKFQAEFMENGEVSFGRGITAEDLFWEIKGGELYLWNAGEENEKKAFKMNKIAGDEWELVSDDITFHLTKRKK